MKVIGILQMLIQLCVWCAAHFSPALNANADYGSQPTKPDSEGALPAVRTEFTGEGAVPLFDALDSQVRELCPVHLLG